MVGRLTGLTVPAGVPYALRQAGLGLGLLLFILVAWMTDASIVMLVRAGNLAGTNTYQDTVMRALGSPGYYALGFLQFTYPFVGERHSSSPVRLSMREASIALPVCG